MNPFIARNLVYYPVKLLRGEFFPIVYWQYQRTEKWSRKRIERYQLERLKRLLNHARYSVPYYRDLFARIGFSPETIHSLSDLSRLPLLNRTILEREGLRMLSRKKFFFVTEKITSGSTAKPVHIYKNAYSICREDAALWRSLKWWGIQPGDRNVRFWGIPPSPRMVKRMKLTDRVMNRLRIPATVFGERDLLNYYEKIKRFRPAYFYGYPFFIERFTRVLVQHGMNPAELKLKAIVTTAEQIFEEVKDFLEETYRTRVVVDYGTSEFGPIAYSCPNGSLHLQSENLIVEVVDSRGQPVPMGELGEIVVTDLHNYAMPFIRYQTGDFGRLSDEYCPCGREQMLLKELVGREINLLMTTDGRYVHPVVPFYLVQEIARKTGKGFSFQLVQVAPKKIIVNVEETLYDIKREVRWFVRDLHKTFGKDMRFEVHTYSQIPRERSGKFMLSKNLIGRKKRRRREGRQLIES